MSQPDTITAQITAADLPPAGPVFVVCLTAPTVEERRRLFDLLTAASARGVRLGLTVVVDEEEGPGTRAAGGQERLAL